MTATLGGSALVILAFFAILGTMLALAVHMESTLQHPRRARVPVRGQADAAESSATGAKNAA